MRGLVSTSFAIRLLLDAGGDSSRKSLVAAVSALSTPYVIRPQHRFNHRGKPLGQKRCVVNETDVVDSAVSSLCIAQSVHSPFLSSLPHSAALRCGHFFEVRS
jgi:hypothetical protein